MALIIHAHVLLLLHCPVAAGNPCDPSICAGVLPHRAAVRLAPRDQRVQPEAVRLHLERTREGQRRRRRSSLFDGSGSSARRRSSRPRTSNHRLLPLLLALGKLGGASERAAVVALLAAALWVVVFPWCHFGLLYPPAASGGALTSGQFRGHVAAPTPTKRRRSAPSSRTPWTSSPWRKPLTWRRKDWRQGFVSITPRRRRCSRSTTTWSRTNKSTFVLN